MRIEVGELVGSLQSFQEYEDYTQSMRQLAFRYILSKPLKSMIMEEIVMAARFSIYGCDELFNVDKVSLGGRLLEESMPTRTPARALEKGL